MSIATQVRDLEADLAICEAATPGPWVGCQDAVSNSPLNWICQMYEGEGATAIHFDNHEANARFVANAREGWPYAIRRALAAEAEIDRLRDEIRMLQEQLEQRCYRA